MTYFLALLALIAFIVAFLGAVIAVIFTIGVICVTFEKISKHFGFERILKKVGTVLFSIFMSAMALMVLIALYTIVYSCLWDKSPFGLG